MWKNFLKTFLESFILSTFSQLYDYDTFCVEIHCWKKSFSSFLPQGEYKLQASEVNMNDNSYILI